MKTHCSYWPNCQSYACRCHVRAHSSMRLTGIQLFSGLYWFRLPPVLHVSVTIVHTHDNTFQLHRLYKIRDLCFCCRHHHSNLVVSWWENLESISHTVLPSPERMSILNFWRFPKAKCTASWLLTVFQATEFVSAWLADSSQATIALKTNVQLSKPFAVWQMVHILS